MATREEVLTNLTKAAKQGNIRDAYRDFEELPFVDQVAISIFSWYWRCTCSL
jgi:hypothetical protein